MNKKTKGILSLGLGAALMIGGAGTFALWFDTAALGSTVTPVNTGNLYLNQTTNVTGKWVWTGVSSFDSPTAPEFVRAAAQGDPEDVDYVPAVVGSQFTGSLVPGDQVAWEWTSTQISYFLSGDTIVAHLYLDGAWTPLTEAELKPLQIQINGKDALLQADGSLLIKSGLYAGTESQTVDSLPVPTFTLTFPRDKGATGHGHLPANHPSNPATIQVIDTDEESDTYGLPITVENPNFDASAGYGRNRNNVNVIDISAVQVRLQQVPTS